MKTFEKHIFIKFKNENLFVSILNDVFTFGCLLVSFYLNYQFIGNSTILSIVLAISFFLFVLGRTTIKKYVKEFPDKEKAIEYLKNI